MTIYARGDTTRRADAPVCGYSLSPSYGRVKRNNRQQLFGIGEHFFLNDRAQFLIAGPVWITAAILRPCAKNKVDDFITEIFWITDAGWFLYLLQFRIKRLTVKQLSGIRIAILLILDPEVGISDIAVKDILTIF